MNGPLREKTDSEKEVRERVYWIRLPVDHEASTEEQVELDASLYNFRKETRWIVITPTPYWCESQLVMFCDGMGCEPFRFGFVPDEH